MVFGESGTIFHKVSGFSALKATSFLEAFFPFFFGEFLEFDCVNIHNIWINFWSLLEYSFVLGTGHGVFCE